MTRAPVQAAAPLPAARAVAPAVSVHEREADRAAELVGAGGTVAGWSFTTVPPSPPPARRRPARARPKTSGVDAAERVLGAGGRPLDARTRRLMEAGFGQSFADVRIHTGDVAASSAAALDAHAYTSGRDVVFGPGRYESSTPAGLRLLAHELAHVIQQRRSASPGPIQRYAAYSSAEQTGGSSRGWVHPGSEDMRVSDDGQMATDDKGWDPGTNKRAWTTPALIAASNSILSAQGSRAGLREKSGGDTIAGSAPEGGAASTLKEIEPFKPGGGTFSLISDCGHACRQIIGSGPVGSRDVAVFRREARPGSSGTGGAWLGGIIGLLAGAAAGAWLGSLLPGPLGVVFGIVGLIGGAIGGAIGGSKLGRKLARRDPVEAREDYSSPQTYHAGPPSTPEDFSGELYQRELGGATPDEGIQRYAAMSEGERDEFDRRHGINRYARPHVGEGVTIGSEYRMPGFADPTGSAWNFHYAAAVLDSGHDYVTLETAAHWGVDDWIFYMYGPPSKHQSFQEEQAATGTHGTRQTSLVVLPEFRLDVHAGPLGTSLRTDTGMVAVPAGQALHVLERRTPTGATEEVRVRVVGGPNDGVEGWVPAGAIV